MSCSHNLLLLFSGIAISPYHMRLSFYFLLIPPFCINFDLSLRLLGVDEDVEVEVNSQEIPETIVFNRIPKIQQFPPH